MKTLILVTVMSMLASACSTPGGPRRNPIRDCPVGMVLVCETNRDQEPASRGDEEIPEYDRCYCEDIM